MPAYANGTVYGKYIKIKSGTVGVKKCSDYINDPEKIQPLPKDTQGKKQETYQTESAIHYIQNDPKIINPSTGKCLVSGHNCYADTAFQEFSLIEKLYHAHKSEKLAPGQTPNQAFHIILSYKGRDTNPDIIHEMGCEFARRLCGDEFQALIATHLNTNNYHNHILVNAYALDGRHKFKDSYHVYQKFRQIANEISLEYGLPVFVNNKKERPYKSWKEFIATEEGESWKQTIIHDLDESISAADSYAEVLQQMEQKGYEIQHNPKSITFKKEDVLVRDRRLGYAYTYEGICSSLEKKKQKEELQSKKDTFNKQQELRIKNTLYRSIYVPRYDQYGRRRNFLTRFLLMLKQNISTTISTSGFLPAQASSPEPPSLKKAEKQIKLLEEWLKIADQDGITNMNILEIQLRELHAKNAPYLRAIFNLEDYLENAGKIKQLIEKYRELEPVLAAQTIDIKDILSIPDPTIIQENCAKLNPMQAKTRSDLFQALHNSPYRLMRKFKTLTETEAQQIIKVIRKEQKENLPDGLYYGRKRWNKQKQNQDFSNQTTEKSFIKRKPINLKNYNPETKQAILDFKETADILASYGLTNEIEMDKFLDGIAEKVAELELQKSFSKEINIEIKKLFQLKKVLSQFPSSAFIHQKLMADEHKSSTLYDMLLYMKSRLEKLPDIKEQDFQTSKLPNPDEYRFIYDLQSIYPDKLNIHSMTPEDIHVLIVKLKTEGFFEMEMAKALENEKRERRQQNEQNNLERR